MKLALAFLIAFAIGAGCRYFDVPAPAPPLIGAFLVLSMSLGYITVDRWVKPPPPAAITTRRD